MKSEALVLPERGENPMEDERVFHLRWLVVLEISILIDESREEGRRSG